MARGTQLQAVLHEDSGKTDEFEFPVADFPVRVLGQPVTKSFVLGLPMLNVNDQKSNGSLISVDEVLATYPSWIVIYDTNRQVILGVESVPVGVSKEIDIRLEGYRLGENSDLVAALHTNYGQFDKFEFPGSDIVVFENGNPVITRFNVTYEQPQISASSSLPILGNSVVISQVIAFQDGWLVAYSDDNGSIGNVCGFVRVSMGENNNVNLELQPPFAVGETIWFVLHIDDGNLGELELPDPDVSVTSENEVVQFKATLAAPLPQFLGNSGSSPLDRSLLTLLSAFVSSGLLIGLSIIRRPASF